MKMIILSPLGVWTKLNLNISDCLQKLNGHTRGNVHAWKGYLFHLRRKHGGEVWVAKLLALFHVTHRKVQRQYAFIKYTKCSPRLEEVVKALNCICLRWQLLMRWITVLPYSWTRWRVVWKCANRINCKMCTCSAVELCRRSVFYRNFHDCIIVFISIDFTYPSTRIIVSRVRIIWRRRFIPKSRNIIA